MNLDYLKPAWRQFRLLNSMQRMDAAEIISLLEGAEGMAISKTNRLLMHAVLFFVLIFCCQGG